MDWVTWVTLMIASVSLYLSVSRQFFLVPAVNYSVIPLSEYPGTGAGLSLSVHRVETPGPISLKWGCRVRIESVGIKAASDIQVRASAPAGAFIVQVHTNDEHLVQRLPDIGRQGVAEMLINIPLMVKGEDVELTFWYGFANSGDQPPSLGVVLRHSEGLGRRVRPKRN